MSKLIDKKLKLILIIVGALVVLITVGALVYLSGIGAVDSKNDDPVAVSIPTGSGASAIVEILDEEGLVKNKTCAKIHARIGGYDSLQANSYVFSKAMTLPEMFKAINTGDFQYISKEKFTIIEGARLPDAAAAMAEELPFTAEEIMAVWNDRTYLQGLIDQYWFITDEILADGIMYPLEGYLYPETYFVTEEDPSVESITATILDKTDQELTERKKEIKKMDMTVHQFLTLASVVQDEASSVKEDKPKVAGVFINRLNIDMSLQSCSTALYALQKRHINVSNLDISVDSPYNTYKYGGLPIGPIGAVPADTMDSVINYEKHDYLYFFSKEDGTMIYSKTAAEHEKAVSENQWY